MNYGISPMAGGGLSLMRILGSLSRTLGVVRQVAPLYRDLKPLLSKMPQVFARINDFKGSIRDTKEKFSVNNYPIPSNESIPQNSPGPVFFQ